MNDSQHFLDNAPQLLTAFLDKILWLVVTGLFKYFIIPAALILLLLMLVRYIFRRIVEGDFEVSFEWLKSLAGWFSKESGWHQTRWGMIVISVAGGLITLLIVKIWGG